MVQTRERNGVEGVGKTATGNLPLMFSAETLLTRVGRRMKMKRFILFVVAALVVAIGTSAYAELKNVEVGGLLRVRGERIDPTWFDRHNAGDDFVSSTIRLNVNAELTEGVSAFIELQEIDIWGNDMKVRVPGGEYGSYYPESDGYGWMYLPELGVPPSLSEEDGFSLYQGYITIKDVGDVEGLSLMIGRQELAYGTEFILGNNDFGPGLSYDAVKAVYEQDDVRVDAFWAKLAEGRNSWNEDDADVDMYGIYSTYTGMENNVIDAYFLFLRAADLEWSPQWPAPIDDGWGMDDAIIQLYTFGARIGGVYEAIDYNVEGAFQVGADGYHGDYQGSAIDAGVGYTFDYNWHPRLGFNYTFSSGDSGENDKDIETFIAPFSDNYHRYGYMDLFGLGNLNVLKLSATADPTEKIKLGVHGLTFLAVEHEDNLAPFGGAGRDTADHDMVGNEVDLVANYAYSEDLSFEAAFAYFLPGPYIKDVYGERDNMYRLYLQAKLVF